jgi:hypothetical protein
MVKFSVKLILLDVTPVTLNFVNINANSPEEAIEIAVKRQWMEEPRSVDVGDCAIVFNPANTFTSNYIFDINLDVKEVSKPEFDFWIEHMKTNDVRKAGIQLATGEILHIKKVDTELIQQ